MKPAEREITLWLMILCYNCKSKLPYKGVKKNLGKYCLQKNHAFFFSKLPHMVASLSKVINKKLGALTLNLLNVYTNILVLQEGQILEALDLSLRRTA